MTGNISFQGTQVSLVFWVKVMCVTLDSNSWLFMSLESCTTIYVQVVWNWLQQIYIAGTLEPYASGCNAKGQDKTLISDEMTSRMYFFLDIMYFLRYCVLLGIFYTACIDSLAPVRVKDIFIDFTSQMTAYTLHKESLFSRQIKIYCISQCKSHPHSYRK